MSTAVRANKSALSKLQAGTAALALATAATITPVVAHAAPNLGTIAEGVGNSVELVLDPVIINSATPGDTKAAAKAAVANATPAELVQQLVKAISDGIATVVDGVVKVAGTVVYATVAFTGGVITAVGEVVPGALGDAIKAAGKAVTQVANTIAETVHIGPYGTSST